MGGRLTDYLQNEILAECKCDKHPIILFSLWQRYGFRCKIPLILLRKNTVGLYFSKNRQIYKLHFGTEGIN